MNKEEVMERWDMIHDYIKRGDFGSLPRDIFESIIDGYEEDIAQLRAENKDLKHKMDTKYWDRIRNEIDRLRAENERLRGYFDKYAKHKNDEFAFCDKLMFKHSDFPCTCGFDEARQALNADGEPTE